MAKRCEVDPNDFSKWNLEDIRILLAQAVCHLIPVITSKIMGKE
jgi:acyl-CoA oxidase